MLKRLLVLALSLSVLLNLFLGFRFTATARSQTVVSQLKEAEIGLRSVLDVQPTPSSVLISPLFTLERAGAFLAAQAEFGREDLSEQESDLLRAIAPLRMIVLTPHTLTAEDVEHIKTALAVVQQISFSLQS